MSQNIQVEKHDTIDGINYTREYNNCMFEPIRKYYLKASGKATRPLVAIASKCMQIGMEIGNKAFKEVLSNKERNFDKTYTRMNIDIDEAVVQFYSKESDLIKSLPVTYYTRQKKNLIEYIREEIKAGVLFLGEVVIKQNTIDFTKVKAI